KGYEVAFSKDGFIGVAVWEGPFNVYHAIEGTSPVGCPGVDGCDGHLLGASIVGNEIKVYIDGIEVESIVDDTYSTGQPGIGFFRRECGTNQDLGWREYTATGL